MTEGYTEVPHNMAEIMPYIVTEKEEIVSEIIEKPKCWFYDTCSFRRHANLEYLNIRPFLEYIKSQDGIIILTRCILMELASHSRVLNQEYIEYVKNISQYGIKVLVMYEEDVFSVMEVCFGTNTVINKYLCWAVRMIKDPVSTITEALEGNPNINNELIKGKNMDNSGVYQRFFEAVRKNKESGDNLGEELLAVCLHILSHIPGEPDGKFCVITEDKGAAGKIDGMFKKTAKQYRGKAVGIFSTPKLVQVLYREHRLNDRQQMKEIIGAGSNGRIIIIGLRIYDLHSKEISINAEELVDLIQKPNGINIIF